MGASRAGGRWNSVGVPVVYLGGSLALAALELLVPIDYERALQEMFAIPVDFGGSLVLRVDGATLPADWQSPQGLAYTQGLGDAWVRREASALLEVPSRVIPLESNYVLNLHHPGAHQITIGDRHVFGAGTRLLKR